MKLGCASEGNLTEAKTYVRWSLLQEHETAPTWAFNYQRFRNDPTPKILLLGSYRHPATGNNLIGGINLNYLTNRQKLRLRKELPNLLKAPNLYVRYHLGLSLLPDIFDNFYRTYNPAYIRGIKKEVIIPKVPVQQAATDLIRHRLDKVRKSREQRQQEYMPRYPKDISDMEKEIDKKTQEIVQRDPQDQPQDAPEVLAAQQNQRQFERDKEHPEDIAIKQLEQEIEQEPDGYVSPEPEITTRGELRSEIEDETEETEEELEGPYDDPDPLDPDDELEESIIYYDPHQRRYIIEPAYEIVSHWKPRFR